MATSRHFEGKALTSDGLVNIQVNGYDEHGGAVQVTFGQLNEYAFPGGSFVDDKNSWMQLFYMLTCTQSILLRDEIAESDDVIDVSGAGFWYPAGEGQYPLWFTLQLYVLPEGYDTDQTGERVYRAGNVGFLHNPPGDTRLVHGTRQYVSSVNQRFKAQEPLPTAIFWDLAPGYAGQILPFVLNTSADKNPKWSYSGTPNIPWPF